MCESIERLLDLVTDSNRCYELEARFGRFHQDGRFDPMLPVTDFFRLKALLLQFQGWSRHSELRSRKDFFFKTSGNQLLRQSVESLHERTTPSVPIYKHRVGHINFQLSTNRQFGVRVSLSLEDPVVLDDDSLRFYYKTELVRLKMIRSFEYTPQFTPVFSNGSPQPLWRYDLCTVWSGTTYAEAEHCQRISGIESNHRESSNNTSVETSDKTSHEASALSDKTSCEFEIECINVSNAINQFGKKYLAQSLFGKIQDICQGDLIVSHGGEK
jgi:hypothetical protein